MASAPLSAAQSQPWHWSEPESAIWAATAICADTAFAWPKDRLIPAPSTTARSRARVRRQHEAFMALKMAPFQAVSKRCDARRIT